MGPDSAGDDNDVHQGFQLMYRMSACIKLSVNCNSTQTHHSQWTEAVVMRSLTRLEPQPTYLRLRSRRTFHCRVSPTVFSHAADW